MKIAIIDDDKIIRTGLSKYPWEDNGFQLVGVASDGEKGLELFEEFQPQIVISDINMPFMSGLEMATVIRNKYPNTKIILLTGYDDFKYAHEAIKLRAFDYLLKPVNQKELIEKVRAAGNEAEFEQKREMHIKEGLPLLHQQFFGKLIHQPSPTEEIIQEMRYLGIDLINNYFAAFIIKIDQFDHNSFRDSVSDHVYKICDSILRIERKGVIFAEQEDEFVIIVSAEDGIELSNQKNYKLAEEIRTKVEECQKTTVTISIGNLHHDFSGINLSYKSARLAMEFRHIIGKNNVFSILDTGIPTESENINIHIFEDDLLYKVKLGLAEPVLKTIEKFKTQILNSNFVSLHNIRLFSIQIIVLLFQESAQWAEKWEENNRGELPNLYNRMNTLETVEEIFELITEISLNLCAFVNVSHANVPMKDSLVEKAMKYMENNYHQEKLSLKEVADHVHVSSAYLSNIFKVEKGVNFSDFLLQTRMKKAMELLRQPDIKTYEVAEMVGFSNPQYFSVCFKKYTSYSPYNFKKLR